MLFVDVGLAETNSMVLLEAVLQFEVVVLTSKERRQGREAETTEHRIR